jgi:hypothetical protein
MLAAQTTGTSRHYTRRSSRSAGAQRSLAIYPRYTGLRRELETYLHFYNNDRVHHGRLTQGRTPADIVYGAHKRPSSKQAEAEAGS